MRPFCCKTISITLRLERNVLSDTEKNSYWRQLCYLHWFLFSLKKQHELSVAHKREQEKLLNWSPELGATTLTNNYNHRRSIAGRYSRNVNRAAFGYNYDEQEKSVNDVDTASFSNHEGGAMVVDEKRNILQDLKAYEKWLKSIKFPDTLHKFDSEIEYDLELKKQREAITKLREWLEADLDIERNILTKFRKSVESRIRSLSNSRLTDYSDSIRFRNMSKTPSQDENKNLKKRPTTAITAPKPQRSQTSVDFIKTAKIYRQSKENNFRQIQREFNAINGKYEVKSSKQLEDLDNTRKSRFERKFNSLQRCKTWHEDMKKLQSVSRNEIRRNNIKHATWFDELMFNLPDCVKDHCSNLMEKIAGMALEEFVPDSITSPAFFKILQKLRTHELRNPEIASAIEFVRKNVIINLSNIEFKKWIDSEYVSLR